MLECVLMLFRYLLIDNTYIIDEKCGYTYIGIQAESNIIIDQVLLNVTIGGCIIVII